MADPTVTERFYPFSEGPGEFVTEEDWAAMTRGFQDDGVYGHPGTTALKIQPGPDPGTIQIGPGDAQLAGFHYRLTAPTIINTVANAQTADRWDTVVLQLDREAKSITPTLLPGVAVSAIGTDRCLLGLWRQPPAAQVTSTYWGSAQDARWFIGNRVRPYMPSATPPAAPGGLIYDPNESGASTVYLGKLDSNGRPYWAPWYPLSPERMDPVEAEHNTDVTTTSAAFAAGNPQVSVTFTAPPSGRVYVSVYAQLEAESPGWAMCGFEIRNNNASGAVVVPPSQDVAAAQQEDRFSASSRRKLVTGLTPGAQYFARTMHRSSASGTKATIFHRAILVEPVYTSVAPHVPPNGGSGLLPSDVVLTSGGSTIQIPDGDTATKALTIRLPAGDRTNAADSLGIYVNEGSEATPTWRRVTHTNGYGDLRVTPSAVSRIGLAVQANAGQSADLFQVRDSSGVPVAGFRADGQLFAPNHRQVLVLGPTDPVPAGTAPGTLIFRS